MAKLRELVRIALPVDDRSNDGLSGHPDHIAQDFGQLQVHLHQCLLHALYLARLLLQQRVAMPHHGAQHAHFVGRPIGSREQPVAHQLLQPLAVQHIGLAPWYVLHMPRVHQIHCKATPLEQLIERDPVHPRRAHNITPINMVRALLFSIRFILFVVSE
jgi:hypothetical protein